LTALPVAVPPLYRHWLPVTSGGGETIDKEDLLTLECDVLVPAAIGGVIHEGNAASLNCKFVAEAANGPTTPEVRTKATLPQ
jgi:glutamate dehydrogenase/leucine dehydrogenase